MSGDPEQEYFSDGISEDIIIDLSKVSALSTVARNVAFALKGKSIDPEAVMRDQGATHVLEGSVRKAGTRGAHHCGADRLLEQRAALGRSL